MSLIIPDTHHRLFEDVERRFRQLLRKNVVTGIDETRFDNWLANFWTDADRYLAARILDGLTYRSNAMVCSSIDHLLQCILPLELRRVGLHFDSVDALLAALEDPGDGFPIRFVAVDGAYESEPGKSGAVVIRLFRRHARIHKKLTCRPDGLGTLPGTVKCLVFVDDMVGTGRQFVSFAKTHQLTTFAPRLALLYAPLMAFDAGILTIERDVGVVAVRPVETIDARHAFYRESSKPGVWGADEVNTVADVRAHVLGLVADRGIPTSTRHSLDLVLGFEHATPNNSLPLLWARSPTWAPLLIR